MKNIFYCLCFLIILGCTKNVYLDDQFEKRLVVVGDLHLGEKAQLELYETVSATDTLIFPRIENAVITLENNLGVLEELTSIGLGIYVSDEIIGTSETEYTITINYENETYKSISQMPKNLIQVNEVNYEKSFSADMTFFINTSISINKLGEEPVYESVLFYRNNFQIFSDQIFESDVNQTNVTFDTNIPFSDWELGDSLKIEIVQMEKWLYDYLAEINIDNQSNSVNGLLASPPGDIPNNFDGDILGYFGVHQKETFNMEIE